MRATNRLFLLILTSFIFLAVGLHLSIAHASTIEVATGYTFDDGTGVVPGAGGDSNTQEATSGDLEAELDVPGLRSFEDPWQDEEEPSIGRASATADEDGVTSVRIGGSSATGEGITELYLFYIKKSGYNILTIQ